jgi:hypothetical protein
MSAIRSQASMSQAANSSITRPPVRKRQCRCDNPVASSTCSQSRNHPRSLGRQSGVRRFFRLFYPVKCAAISLGPPLALSLSSRLSLSAFKTPTFSLPPLVFRLPPLAFSLSILLLPISQLPSAASHLPYSISHILSSDAEPSFVERHRLLHSLNGETLRRQSDTLLEYLSQPAVPPTGMEAIDFHSLRNDVADLLISHDIAHAEHLRISLEAIADASGELVWRDYCIQKLPELLNVDGPSGSDRQRAAALIDSLTADPRSGLAGTMLITAMRLNRTPAADLAPATTVLADRAINIARDIDTPLPDRITALQIAAIYAHPNTASVALGFLQDRSDGQTTMLRVAAIAALGELADPAHREVIERYRLSSDTRLRAAARTALARIDN